ncbi:hypothetical protein [Kaarinaea lacus]
MARNTNRALYLIGGNFSATGGHQICEIPNSSPVSLRFFYKTVA